MEEDLKIFYEFCLAISFLLLGIWLMIYLVPFVLPILMLKHWVIEELR